MGLCSGFVNIFVTRKDGTWEEAHKLTPAVGDAGCKFGISVDIYGGTDVIGDCANNDI